MVVIAQSPIVHVDKPKSKVPRKLEQRLSSPKKSVNVMEKMNRAEKNRAAFYENVSDKASSQLSRQGLPQLKVKSSVESARIQNMVRHNKAANLRKANLMAISGKAVLESQKVEEALKRVEVGSLSSEKIAEKFDNAAKNRRAYLENVSHKASKQISRLDNAQKKVSQSIETARVNYETRINKAVDNRKANILARTAKANHESQKVKEAHVRATAEKAIAAKKYAEKTHACATIINVNIQRKSKKIPKNLAERLVNTSL